MLQEKSRMLQEKNKMLQEKKVLQNKNGGFLANCYSKNRVLQKKAVGSYFKMAAISKPYPFEKNDQHH